MCIKGEGLPNPFCIGIVVERTKGHYYAFRVGLLHLFLFANRRTQGQQTLLSSFLSDLEKMGKAQREDLRGRYVMEKRTAFPRLFLYRESYRSPLQPNQSRPLVVVSIWRIMRIGPRGRSCASEYYSEVQKWRRGSFWASWAIRSIVDYLVNRGTRAIKWGKWGNRTRVRNKRRNKVVDHVFLAL